MISLLYKGVKQYFSKLKGYYVIVFTLPKELSGKNVTLEAPKLNSVSVASHSKVYLEHLNENGVVMGGKKKFLTVNATFFFSITFKVSIVKLFYLDRMIDILIKGIII